VKVLPFNGKTLFIETKEGTIYGTIAVARYLNSLVKDKSYLNRKDEFEFALIHQWVSFCIQEGDLSKHYGYLSKCIQSGTYFVGNSLSFADLFILTHIQHDYKSFDKQEFISLGRWFNHMQQFDLCNPTKVHLELKVDKFVFKPIPELHPKKEEKKEITKKEEEKKEEKKEVTKKDEKKKIVEEKKEPCVITFGDIRVGHIISVKKHEKADRLYVESINVGEEAPRIICSGLVPHMGLEDLENKQVLVFCNLKPKNAVGIDSNGMVLCSTDSETKKVQLLKIPDGSKPGDIVTFGDEKPAPEKQLHERKLKAILEDLKTDENGNVIFKGLKAMVNGKGITSDFKNAHVS